MLPKRVAVVPGDGIGVEVTREAVRALEALKLGIEVEHFDWGADRFLRTGETLPKGALDDLRARFGAILFGAVGDPRVPDGIHAKEILLALRFELDLYINWRPVDLLDERLCPLKGKGAREVDMLVLRENTEGPYVQMGGTFKQGTLEEVAITEDLNTRRGVDRILRAAFEAARGRRRKVTMADKANALPFGHGLWRRAFAAMQKEFPDVKAEALYADVAAMEMVRTPERFDVLVTSNLLGDILTDLGAVLSGGLGLAASGNVHPGRVSLFEPIHGSAPDIAGQGVANPIGAIRSLALLLRHLDEPAAADRLERAVKRALLDGKTTRDLGGDLTTRACADYVIDGLG